MDAVVVLASKREWLLTWPALVGEAEGVDCRKGEGETGDSGRRKGELRGEVNAVPPPPPRDEFLGWPAGRAWNLL